MTRKHKHYFKDIRHLTEADVYRFCDLFAIPDPSGATQHAIKKLAFAGSRGAKDYRKDLEEARDTIIRKLEMLDEDESFEAMSEEVEKMRPITMPDTRPGQI